jgi:hypothetical protein
MHINKDNKRSKQEANKKEDGIHPSLHRTIAMWHHGSQGSRAGMEQSWAHTLAKLESGAEPEGHRPCASCCCWWWSRWPPGDLGLKQGDADETVGCLWGQADGKKGGVGEWFVCWVWPGRWSLFIGSPLSYFNRRRRFSSHICVY